MDDAKIEQVATKIRHEVAANLKAWRQRRGWTQEDAANHCDMALRYYQKLEAGTQNIEIATLARISVAVRADAWHLLHPEGIPRASKFVKGPRRLKPPPRQKLRSR